MSKYYYCEDCGEVVHENELLTCTVKEGEYWHEYACCPNCKGITLEEMTECKMCGQPVRDGEDYCDDCKKEAYQIWDDAVTKVMDIRYDRGDLSTDWMSCRDAFVEYLDSRGVL